MLELLEWLYTETHFLVFLVKPQSNRQLDLIGFTDVAIACKSERAKVCIFGYSKIPKYQE